MADHPPSLNEVPPSAGDPSEAQALDYCTQLVYGTYSIPPQMNSGDSSAVDIDDDALIVNIETISNLLGYTDRRGQSGNARSPSALPKLVNKAHSLSRTTVQPAPLVFRRRVGSLLAQNQYLDSKYQPYPKQHTPTISPSALRAHHFSRHDPTFPLPGQVPRSSPSQVLPPYSFGSPIENGARTSSSFNGWAPQERQWPRVPSNVSGYEETGFTPEDGSFHISRTVEPSQTLLMAPPLVDLGDNHRYGGVRASVDQMHSILSPSRVSADGICQAQLSFEAQHSYEVGNELHVNRITPHLPEYDLIRSTTVESALDQAQTTPHKSAIASNDLSASSLIVPLRTARVTADEQSMISTRWNLSGDETNLFDSHEVLDASIADTEPPTTEMEAERLQAHFKKQSGQYRCIYFGENGPCNTPFPRKSRLLDHIRTHTGDRPYICKTECPQNLHGCGLRYPSAESLRGHQKVKKECSICGTFITYSNLARHKTSHQTPQL